MIVSALAQSRGRISGPKGAAAALGLPPSTLEARIKKLNIRKNRIQAWLGVKTIRHILWFPQFHKIRTASAPPFLLYFQSLQIGVLRALP